MMLPSPPPPPVIWKKMPFLPSLQNSVLLKYSSMTFNILAFIIIHVCLSSEKILAKSKIWAGEVCEKLFDVEWPSFHFAKSTISNPNLKCRISSSESQRVFWNCLKKELDVHNYFLVLHQNQDFLLHMPMGNGGLSQEPLGGGGRLTVGASTLPAPDLSAPLTAETVCSCEACYERRWVPHQSQ